jgi:hypothetical protein
MTVAVCSVETLQLLQSEVLEHVPYSTDLDPLQFPLFEPLRDALRSHNFASNHELRKAVHMYCVIWSETFFLFFPIADINLCNTKKHGDYIRK